MNIKITDKWLREYLKTKAKPQEIARQLSLCGPSVERLEKHGKDWIYDIEVTTNRVDCMSVMGIAREVAVILPNAKLVERKYKKIINSKKQDLLQIKIDAKLVKRVMAVVMDVTKTETPKTIKERLELSGMRSLNSYVDITNYVMLETGHPTHVFDYDLIKDGSLVFRPSDKGEKITSFDGKTYELPGDDIVIDNGEGEIIDLPGIIGTKNSVVNNNTKRIVFFIDNNDENRIRKTSTRLGIRTVAAILNEKGVDPELAPIAFSRGLELYKEICKAKISSKVYDSGYTGKTKKINIDHAFIEKVMGIEIPAKRVIEILEKLGFDVKRDKRKLRYEIKVPSWRSSDITIPEDIVEEVARIYGYHNLPSVLMTGRLPKALLGSPFKFEWIVKNTLKGYGGLEIYTLSLVPKDYVGHDALALKNPLGDDTKYLRTGLKKSLVHAADENSGEKEPFFLFEMANVYIKQKNTLPSENMMLGIIFSNYAYRRAKGVIETLFEELNNEKQIENLELLQEGRFVYFEIGMTSLMENSNEFAKFRPIPRYPAQVEDLTLVFPPKTKIGEVTRIFESNPLIRGYDLSGIYDGNTYTFRIWYQDLEKTLTDEDVEMIRNKILKEVKEKFGGVVKA